MTRCAGCRRLLAGDERPQEHATVDFHDNGQIYLSHICSRCFQRFTEDVDYSDAIDAAVLAWAKMDALLRRTQADAVR
jgi:hypothetical protein